MREKNVPNSYLNQRVIVEQDTGVQAETLAPATVKITSDLAAFANPYSILTNEFAETKVRATASFVIDPVELAKQEVKLPTPQPTVINEVSEEPKEEKAPENKTKEKEYVMPEIPVADVAPKAPQMSDMEALNRLAAFQPVTAEEKPAVNFDVPKDAELLKPKEENVSNDLEILNDLQADETETKKSKNTKQEMNTAMNGLEGLLAELSDGGDSNILGMG